MESTGFSEMSVHIYHCCEHRDHTNINETDRYLGGAELLYLSIWFFIILGYCQRQQVILQDSFFPLWRLNNNKSLRILHGRWVLLLHLQLMTLILTLMIDQKVCCHNYRKRKVGYTVLFFLFFNVNVI